MTEQTCECGTFEECYNLKCTCGCHRNQSQESKVIQDRKQKVSRVLITSDTQTPKDLVGRASITLGVPSGKTDDFCLSDKSHKPIPLDTLHKLAGERLTK